MLSTLCCGVTCEDFFFVEMTRLRLFFKKFYKSSEGTKHIVGKDFNPSMTKKCMDGFYVQDKEMY
ncbi:hypothetical protein BKM63_12580 [Flavobacterium johnsoniae]|uniref:Uncharacterized protein n=1 Tax=Flavobacterium johnsoniae TaxID=986 RepID=A0A1J7BRY6_FLAJO|nr:hypothetical protein BKM63_12580 [Flavobacterium johnsoniae]